MLRALDIAPPRRVLADGSTPCRQPLALPVAALLCRCKGSSDGERRELVEREVARGDVTITIPDAGGGAEHSPCDRQRVDGEIVGAGALSPGQPCGIACQHDCPCDKLGITGGTGRQARVGRKREGYPEI